MVFVTQPILWLASGFIFLFLDDFGNGEKLRRMFMDLSQERESIIIALLLQFKEVFLF